MANTVKTGSVLPYYGAAAVWVAWAALGDLYKMSHFLFVGILSIGVFILLRAVCGDKAPETTLPASPPAEEASTGNAELDKIITAGREAIHEMKRLDDAIEDEAISANIRRLESISQRIFDQVKENPEKIPQIHQFMDYYLPTTLKLLHTYRRMDAAGVSGENITKTKAQVERALTTIVQAFAHLLDSLFGSDALDISTDISVLETLLAQEGLTGEKLKAETGRSPDSSEIHLP